ncbi:hypothetical protein ACIBG8_49535 [Nonomuraea sp. NPDC050556]|uniref:hypothetical protein n=1 Tax=Nonomuraea sp. NPDC050556 TaxID=3364369 RepID=UPI0037A4DBFB
MSIQDELRQVDEDLAKLRASTAELREQVGDMGPTDAAERSAMLQLADDNDELIAELEARREGLRKRLDG